MLEYLSGAVTMGLAVSSLFFIRFWLRSHDSLFLYFAIAFALLTSGQAIIGISGVWREEYTWIYLIRLAAFSLIAGAIVAKNLRKDA